MNFLIFCKRSMKHPCRERKATAGTYLLSTDPLILKVVRLYYDGVVMAAETGLPDQHLYATSLVLAKKWRCDTEEVEGYNQVLKHEILKGPNISRELLSARANLCKELGVAGRKAASYKWDDISDTVYEIREEILDNMSGGEEVLTVEKLGRRRWAPLTADLTEREIRALCPLPAPPRPVPSEHKANGIRASLMWKSKWNPSLAPLDKCITFGEFTEMAWLCPKTLGGSPCNTIRHNCI